MTNPEGVIELDAELSPDSLEYDTDLTIQDEEDVIELDGELSPVIDFEAELCSDELEYDAEFELQDLLELDGDIGIIQRAVTNDYRPLINKPSINGTELYDNYDEIDPTVPAWAKTESKPEYTAEEVGALDEDAEMSLTDVKEIWDSIFKRGE